MLPLFATFNQIGETQVIYRALIDVVAGKRVRREERHVLLIDERHGIGPQVGCNFERLILQDRGTRRLQRVVVLERQIDGLIERDAGRRMLRRRGLRSGLSRGSQGSEQPQNSKDDKWAPRSRPGL